MSRSPAPSMPTERQIRDALKVVRAIHPDAQIAKVGPKGVSFSYPKSSDPSSEGWQGKPFSAEGE